MHRIEIHFAVVNITLISFVFLCETCQNLVTVFNKENCMSAGNLQTKSII